VNQWHYDALKHFDSLNPRRVMEMTFEVARLRRKPPHRDTKIRRIVLAQNADVLVRISAS
jgi:hypothetical protein